MCVQCRGLNVTLARKLPHDDQHQLRNIKKIIKIVAPRKNLFFLSRLKIPFMSIARSRVLWN